MECESGFRQDETTNKFVKLTLISVIEKP